MSEPWTIFFNGTARQNQVEAGVIFITLEGEVLPFFFSITNVVPIIWPNIKP
jgi:hypothetical protein